MNNYKRFVNYDNALIPLNEGFFSWLKGLLKNLIGGIFHVDSYEKFVDRLNKMPRIILGLDSETTNESQKVNIIQEEVYIPKRSRTKIFEGRSRFATPLTEGSNKMDNLGLDKDLIKNLLNYGNSLIKKESSNVSFTDEQKEKLVDIYNNKVKKDRNLEAFSQKIDKDGENGIKGFENKDYYIVLYAIKTIVETDNKDKEVKEDNEIISFLDACFNESENEELKKQIEEFKSKISKLEEDIRLLEKEKDKIKEEDEKALSEALKAHREIESELRTKIKDLEQSNEDKDNIINILISTYAPKIEELEKEVEKLKEENEALRKENDKLNAEIKHMRGEDYESEFKPITYDDLSKKTKMPSFKNALIQLLASLNDRTRQLNDKITPEILETMRNNLQQKKTINMSDIQVIEIAVSSFINLYSSGKLGLPKPQKGQELNVSELSQYKNVVQNSDPSKKFVSLYEALEKVVEQYKESFYAQWKEIRDKEVKYQQNKADNASWSGDGDVSYETLEKMHDNELEIESAINDIIDGCRSLIPNAIMGYFISSPIYKAAEEKINEMIDVLIENEKVLEENKKNPDLEVISVFNDILSDTIKEEDKEKIAEASNLFTEKVNDIINNKQISDVLDFNQGESFDIVIKSSGVKIAQKETIDTLMKKMQDVKSRLAFACLYFVYNNKPLKIEEDINGQKVDLFNISAQGHQDDVTQQGESFNKRNNLRKIYDYYTWQK